MADDRRLRSWRRLAAAAAAATYALIVLGGIVRITESGMGCGDEWPLCDGRIIPAMDLETLIEFGHRLAAVAVALLVVALALRAPSREASGPRVRKLRRLAALAVALLGGQVMLGAVTVWLELPPASVVAHLGTAMLLLGTLLLSALEAGAFTGGTVAGGGGRPLAVVRDRAGAITGATALAGLIVVLAGALVANLDAAFACLGFPLCNGRWMPGDNPLAHVQWGHRLLAYALFAWCLFLPAFIGRHRPGDAGARSAAVIVLVLAAVQLVVGAAMVLMLLPGWLRALHLALGAAVYGSLVVLAWRARRPTDAGLATETG